MSDMEQRQDEEAVRLPEFVFDERRLKESLLHSRRAIIALAGIIVAWIITLLSAQWPGLALVPDEHIDILIQAVVTIVSVLILGRSYRNTSSS